MAKELNERLRKLERELTRIRSRSDIPEETTVCVEYETVVFVVGRHFVSANLEPLQFFHLVEHIGLDGAAGAISRLHERLLPLLTCNHEWTDLKRTTDSHVGEMVSKHTDRTAKPQVCRLCTAYTSAGTTLPLVGKA